ncbi:MAG: hypothetical protein AAGB00_13040, partial [Planctomycetota bacterium]
LSSKQHDFLAPQLEPQPHASLQQASSQPQLGSSQQQLGSSQQHEGSSQQQLGSPQPHEGSSQQQLGSSQQHEGSSQQLVQHELFFLPNSLSSKQHDFLAPQLEPQPHASLQQASSQPQLGSSQQQLGSSQQHEGSSQQHDGSHDFSQQAQDGSLAQPHPHPSILSNRPKPKLWPASEMLSMSAPNRYFIEQLLIRSGLPGFPFEPIPGNARRRSSE